MIRRLPGGINNPISRLRFCDGAENRLHRLRQVKSTSGTARPCTDHRKRRLGPLTQFPWTVALSQHRDLLLKQLTASVASTVMISKQDGHRQRQLRDALDHAQISIAEIAHEKECIRLQSTNQFCISLPPVTMEVSGNGNSE